MGRRSCLRLAGTALGAATVFGAGMGSAAAESGTVNAKDLSGTVNVSSGESVEIQVGDNQYGDYGDLENVLIDISASGADATIKTHGGDWTVRNVGVKGKSDGSLDNTPMLSVRNPDGGSGLVENVYLGDGSGNAGRHGILVQRDHAGTATIKRTYVEGWADNGIYGGGPGKSGGGGGEVHIEECFAKDNGTSNFRVSTSGSYVKDSVVVATDGGFSKSRGIWARGGNIDVSNTDITTDGVGSAAINASNGASVTYKNSDYESSGEGLIGDVDTSDVGDNPSTSPPSGVPTSASEAAGSSSSDSSSSSDDSSSDDSSSDSGNRGGEGDASSEANTETEDGSGLSNEVTIRSQTGDMVEYRFSVSGEVEAQDSGNHASGDTAWGAVGDYHDDYDFSGEFEKFRYDGPIEIDVNGETVYTD